MNKSKIDTLRIVLEFITDNPHLHEQNSWFFTGDVDPLHITSQGAVQMTPGKWDCGTKACLAGWTAIFQGWRPIAYGFHSEMCKLNNSGDLTATAAPGEWAREFYGLRWSESVILFDYHNTLHDLWLISSVLSDGAIQVPDTVLPSTQDWWDSEEDIKRHV